MEIAALTGVATIGKGLLAGTIGDLYSFLKTSAHSEHLEQVLKDLDIKAELDVIQAILVDLGDRPDECKAVQVSVGHVKEIVDLICRELGEIHEKLDYHKTKYLASWRSINCEQHIQQLRAHQQILHKRRKLLLSTLEIQMKLAVHKIMSN